MTKKDQNKHFFEKWSKTYDWAPFQFWMRHFQLPALIEIDVSQKGKLLDISCGTGEFLKQLEHNDVHRNLQVYGLDLSPKMLKKAKNKLSSKVNLLEGDVHQLPFKNNTFDYAISTEAFHHYGNQLQALQEMVRVTKKDGKVIIVDINFFLWPIHWLFERFEPGCVKVNNKKEMKILFEQAGLREIRQERSFLFAVMTMGKKK